MTLEGANMAMKRRGKSVKRDVSILERLQHIRAMLLEVRESLGDNTPAEYEAPIEAMAELISDVEEQAQAEVVLGVTSKEENEAQAEKTKDEVTLEEAPRRRGRPRKVVEPAEETQQSVTRRKPKSKRTEEHKELFPFYEQSLF